MKRLLFPLLLGAVALLAPGRSLAQEKPVLNSAPIVIPAQPTPVPAPVPVPVDTTRRRPAKPTYTPPAGYDEPQTPQPGTNSPSGLELPGREQARKAAQEHADQNTKFFIYTGVGLGYSSVNGVGLFNVSASPAVGYRITDRIAVGPGLSYAYANYSVGNGYPNINTNSIGYKIFAQVIVYKEFFVHGEYEITNAQFASDANGNIYYNPTTNKFLTFNERVQSPLAGIGYRSKFSNRAAGDIVVLYNFNDTYNNRLYTNPVVRFNFLFNIGH